MTSVLAKFRNSIEYRLNRLCETYLDWYARKALEKLNGTQVPKDLRPFVEVCLATRHVAGKINVVVDVGAHRGDFTRAARIVWPSTRAVLVEPDRQMHAKLATVMAQDDVLIGDALGSDPGKATFYRHPNPTMNSLLPVKEEAFGRNFKYYQVSEIQAEPVTVTTLDSLVDGLALASSDCILLKLDTQGNEIQILGSGALALKRINACIVEYMFWDGYENRGKFHELTDVMRRSGLSCTSIGQPSVRPNGAVAYADLIFTRPSS